MKEKKEGDALSHWEFLSDAPGNSASLERICQVIADGPFYCPHAISELAIAALKFGSHYNSAANSLFQNFQSKLSAIASSLH